MKKPIVAVSSDIRRFDNNKWHVTPCQYIEAVARQAQVTPVLIPCLGHELDIDEVLGHCNGLVLTGSKTNVLPSHYGKAVKEEDGPFDEERDETSFLLIREAMQRKIPILAICRGMQELNVALGGDILSEIQDMPGKQDHRAPDVNNLDEKFTIHQNVNLVQGGMLAAILESKAVLVNSLHRQALGRLGEGLVVEARADDGIVEAVSFGGGQFILGVQWHPEYWADTDSVSSKILKAFGDRVRAGL